MSIKVKSVTLTPGRWIYVCPCGFQYSVCRVDKKENGWMIYCFKCKEQTGKYYRVMDERIEFSDNSNGKLNCNSFTVIRLHDPRKYCVGAVKQIYLKGVWKGNAKIIDLRALTLDQLNPFITKLDSGLMPEQYRRFLRERYKNRPGVNWETQLVDFCLLEYDKESKQPTLNF